MSKLKLRDDTTGKDLYWDASGIIVKKYETSSSTDTPIEIIDNHTLEDDFLWIDCGGYDPDWDTGAQLNWEVDQNVGDTEKAFSFGTPYEEKPTVVISMNSFTRFPDCGRCKASVYKESKDGFTVHYCNNSINTTTVIGVNWIAVGK